MFNTRIRSHYGRKAPRSTKLALKPTYEAIGLDRP